MSSNKWKYTKLGEVIDVLGGYAFKSKDFTEQGIPVIKIKNIVPPIIDISDVQYVSEEMFILQKKYSLNYNDILISLTGSNINQLASVVGKVGRVRQKNDRMLLNQRVGKLIVKDANKIDQEFLYYLISQKSVQYELALSSSGSANQANISPKNIKDLEFALPPLNEQKAIAAILSSLDEKIELNNQMNETLEEMAQALFKRWFVDFEFPNEEGNPYKSSGGEMVESELGMIPSTWKVGNLSDISIKIFSGGTPKTTEDSYWNGNYCWLSSGETRNRFILSTEKSITELGVKKSSTKLANKYNTVIASAGQGNTRGQASLLLLDTYINQSLISINPKMEFTFFSFLNIARRYEELRAISDSNSIRGSLTTKMIQKLSIVIPELTILSKFDEIINPIIHQIEKNIEESIYLKDIRDILLPKLMSGEIRVSGFKS